MRSWVSLAESTALIWLDGRRIPRGELELQLVHDFAALAAVSAAYDEEMAAIMLRMLAAEPADGPFAELVDAADRPAPRRRAARPHAPGRLSSPVRAGTDPAGGARNRALSHTRPAAEAPGAPPRRSRPGFHPRRVSGRGGAG